MRRLTIIALAVLALAACKPVSKEAEANLGAAEAFMAGNAKKPGIKALPSGVQYEVVKSGPAGGTSPTSSDEVKVHYEGKLTTGEVFDSSYERGAPATMKLGALIPAWIEALQQMKPGDEWMLYVPPEQGYGPDGAGPIPPNSVLIFRIELIDVLPARYKERPAG
jgi:peptidylprolyl isomerase/FKBP-type peptidyl-prolyl cis-trans isomerase FklB